VSLPERYRLLVVDDDEVDRRALRRALAGAGVEAELHEADDAPAGMEAIRAGRWDCVFLDFQLPGGDGLRVLRSAREEGIDTPVIMLTGHGDQETAVELMKAGASDYVTKGAYTPERLAQGLRHALRVHRAERATRSAEEALRRSEARFRVLHETSPDGFMIFRSVRDAGGAIVDFRWEYANPASEELVRRPAASLMGKRLLEEMPGNAREGLFDLYRDVVEGQRPGQTEVRYEHEEIRGWFRITAAPLEDGFAVAFSDVTAQRRAEEEREAAIASRSRFYAAMSHELRTPINAILGYNDLLLAAVYGTLEEGQEAAVSRAQRAARHLLDLVNDVLDLSKLEAGKMEIEAEPFSITELVHDLFATVRPLAEERGSELRMVEEELCEPIVSDPRRIRQILLNLISNALKFGRSRPVEVRCLPHGDGVQVEVVDRGEGIAEGDLRRIFEEFVQLPSATRGGTGLGLPISRRLAGLLGGRLEAESRPGEGSIFRLTLPAVAPLADADADTETSTDRAAAAAPS
jgi:signal transduction histidine kinase